MKRVLFLLIALFPLQAAAWTQESDERIALKAAQLAPNDLRLLIETFESDYRAGLGQARLDEGNDMHRYFVTSRKGKLRERIERETAASIAAIRSGRPMRDVVQRLGVLSHFVADANNPFHLSNANPKLDESRYDFERYFERRMQKFPTVFYGLEENFRVSSYLDRTFQRTASFYPLLGEEYFRHGSRRTSSEFDDRSTAFGVASICYSRAVTDIVNLYYFIWKEAGGDVRSAPLMRGSNLFVNAN